MGNNLRVKEAIEHGESEGKTFYEIIEAAGSFGWKTFDMAIIELFEQGLITEDTAMLYCTNKGVMTRGLDKVKKTRGESTTSLTGLALDKGYGKKK
jgi:twitching motility protein PilT